MIKAPVMSVRRRTCVFETGTAETKLPFPYLLDENVVICSGEHPFLTKPF